MNYRQKKFVELYDGNATLTAKRAGYSEKTAYAIGHENLKKPEIIQAIKTRSEKEDMPQIASRQNRQAFWTRIMNDSSFTISARLKASELLAKSEADFSEKFNPNINEGLANKLLEARSKVTQIDLDERIKLLTQK